MSSTTSMGFPAGRIAETLRKILYPELTDHEVEAIVVCLLSHLLIEDSLNGTLYRWLKLDAPIPPKEENASRANDTLWNSILKMDFAKKYSLVQPYFGEFFPNEEKNPWEINNLRNEIVHGKAIKQATFRKQPISDEATIEKVFLAAQAVSMQLTKFEEMLDNRHALAERWRKRLEELGEPLL
jgi:hypothetical protein